MFTGLIERVGKIVDARPGAGMTRLRIEVGSMAGDCEPGASVCISGVCLTVTEATSALLSFDVVAETLARTTLGAKHIGDRVNIERSLRMGDRLDGHFVQGHVDGVAAVDRRPSSSREHVVWLRPQETLAPYLIPKGSVAVDGVSLTIAAIEGGTFSVALIPTTLDRTTLSSLACGDRVNIETDIIARTVVHRLSEMPMGARSLTMASLKEAGLA